MTTYKAGDTLPARDITDELIEATIRWIHGGFQIQTVMGGVWPRDEYVLVSSHGCSERMAVENNTTVTVLTPPPVAQPAEPTALGTLVRIEGLPNWSGVVSNPGFVQPFTTHAGLVVDRVDWALIVKRAVGRQIVVSTPPTFPEDEPAEPPMTITEWPADDEPLRGWRWRDTTGRYWMRSGPGWLRQLSTVTDVWTPDLEGPGCNFPMTRVGRA